jgi:DNA-binding transcriptional MerR regulator
MYGMHYSTAQTARKLGIGRQTLHRWIREGIVSPPRKQKVAGVTVRIWTAEDIERLREYKEGNYRKGRGRKPQKKNGNR